ncbi:hypothetical protein KY348_02895 [Candidatus Woesearchaeota archaeon]|nr:hypothetical protein [Candidatus Woesearchaeota archaeon]
MHIIHSFNKKRVDEHVKVPVSFLITNKRGNYISLGENNFTHMQGLFFFDSKNWELYKTVENIKLNKKMSSIKNNFFNVQRLYSDNVSESFNLFNESMLYSVKNYIGEIVLELDFRAMFDYDDKGKIYTIAKNEKDDNIIIRYDKYTDESLSVLDKTRFLVIKGVKKTKDYKQLDEWVKKNYSYDAGRKSKSEFYTYKALSIKVNNHLDLVFSFSDNKKDAKEHARKVYENRKHLINSYKKYMTHAFTSKNLALNTALKALDDLLVSAETEERSVGVFAGLPWFYQFWARDELISLKALMLKDKYYLIKNILFKYLHSIADDGLIPNRLPGSPGDIKSIDAVGWLFVRIKDYIHLLFSKKIISEYLSVSDLIKIKRALEKAIQDLAHHHSDNGLIINNEQETWMDTKPANRKGACIEIQALFLAMINLHNQIAGITKSKQIFKSLEKEHKQRVRKEFFKQGALYDCVDNDMLSGNIRPNIFLAYYIYPGLLTKKEWKKAFDKALKELWLGWGGLSTIEHTSPLFKPEYTGEDDASYHNGDSWYYVNNYAAIAMHRLDKRYYSKYIRAIVHASKEEMLFSGFIGCCAELSSAKHMKSQGCLSQAWSAASFIELMHEMYG